ncbi:unnamed protein product [Dibothriocephalus latus]|uniref:BACK domain-containing protein n=1 Tax=Dibothriocephalus latus TaxID=60516 RepID=A0A3P6VD16_DIBLA|nr:unnamed protein product [Dibothriocephalus latus]
MLRYACLQHMKATFEATIASDFFIQLPTDAVLSLLESEDLQVDSEETVLKAIGRWVSPLGEVDETRIVHAEAMMKEVRWDKFDTEFRYSLQDDDKGFWNKNLGCSWYQLPNSKRKRECAAMVALPDGRVFVIGGVVNCLTYSKSVETCHLREPADWQGELKASNVFWKDVADMLELRRDHAAVAFRDSIFIAGGSNVEGYLNTVDVFTPPDNQRPLGQWTRLGGWDTGRPTAALVPNGSRELSISPHVCLYAGLVEDEIVRFENETPNLSPRYPYVGSSGRYNA